MCVNCVVVVKKAEVRKLVEHLERELSSTRSQVADHETVVGLQSLFAHAEETSA